MRNFPRITIVTPSLNQASFLTETIESVLAQNYPNLEYFVIDGGSTDGSVEIIKTYSSHLNYWHSQTDTGQASAINFGFKRATGDVLAWLNSDDLLVPGALELIANAHESNPENILLGQVELFSQIDSFASVALQGGVTLSNMICIWNENQMSWSQPGTFVPRVLFERAGGLDETYRYVFDREWMCRLLQLTSVTRVDASVAKFRLHLNSKTVAEAPRWSDEQFAVTRKYAHLCPHLNLRRAKAEIQITSRALPYLSGRTGTIEKLEGLKSLKNACSYCVFVIFGRNFWKAASLFLMPKWSIKFIRRNFFRNRRDAQ